MRILHILDHCLPLHSGYTFRTLAILRQQRQLGWQTSHLTSAKQGQSDQSGGKGVKPDGDDAAGVQEIDGWRFFRTAPLRRWWCGLPVLRQVAVIAGLRRRLEQVARSERPHILHAHSPALNAIAALHVGKALGIPVVYEIRAFWEDAAVDHGSSRAGGLRYRLSRMLENYALRRVQAVTTICEGLRSDLLARGIDGARITVIPNAVDSAQFQGGAPRNSALARQLHLDQQPAGHLVLGFIGSFYAYEGLALLIAALPRMLAALPSLRLLLVGGGPQEAALRSQVASLGLQRQVTFAGRIAHQQVADCYQLIDILVYPRLPMRLTELVTPLKPLEAMAQGRLVVASDVGGHRELIEHGKTGMLFEAGNAEALAGQVLALARRADTWAGLRERARTFVREERNWAASVARYRAVYQRLGAPVSA